MRRDSKIICKEYLDFVRSKPCCVSGEGPVDVHHLIAQGWRQAKRNDFTCVPLTRLKHSEVEQIGARKFEKKYNIDLWKEAAFLLMEFFGENLIRIKK